jgi:hypothetical protein
MACRGTGQVISRLGGEPQMVTCPWCKGGGIRLQGLDAQEPWRERDPAAQAGADAAAGGDDPDAPEPA